MDPLLATRLLEPAFLSKHIERKRQTDGARLLSSCIRDVDAPGYLSDLVGVTLTWDPPTGAPTRAILKVSHAGFGQLEWPFYDNIAQHLDCASIPTVFAGGIDEPTGRTWLLMEDLSASHERPSQAPLPPTLARSTSIVEALARFHAAGQKTDSWQATCPSLSDRLRTSAWLDAACERLFTEAGDALAPGTRETYARFLSRYPSLVDRAASMQGITLVHGDAHVWNWMLPRAGIPGTPKLIDWDAWQRGPGVWDLAYMMALQWDRGVRQRFENHLLDRYHAAAAACDMPGCSRQALQDDYRLAVLLHLRTPLARFERGMSAYVWWPQLTRTVQAVEDLRCLELLA
ncbi:aminoglycoside phosphotransferase family protein [Pseudorhodoferax sp. Leaf274]|uniref:phosphotransferase n=1 Tax=Pseudorhodoferax sp. Leaf274 TaxID=1736318 RepID=UPI0007030C8A|nr:aminoglycoside phosphotransferase family protein [Pseudorhodoferax sp. Leaf274]KQP39923.1 hypothetical protein ASF44_09430 [Pseudorhodoferax sp. Leaf274]